MNTTTENTKNTNTAKIARNYLNKHLRDMWKGQRDSLAAAGLDLNSAQLIIPDRKKSYKKMYETYHRPGCIVVALVLLERNFNQPKTDLDQYAAILNPSGFDFVERLGFRKSDFQQYKNDPAATLFILVSQKLEKVEKPHPDFLNTRRPKDAGHNISTGSVFNHQCWKIDRSGYPVKDINERKKYAHNLFARLRREKAVAAFDPTTRAAAMLEAKKKIDNLRRAIAYIVLTHADFINMIGDIQLILRWDVQRYYEHIERTVTAGELESAVKNFNEAVDKVNEILSKYETEKQPATV